MVVLHMFPYLFLLFYFFIFLAFTAPSLLLQFLFFTSPVWYSLPFLSLFSFVSAFSRPMFLLFSPFSVLFSLTISPKNNFSPCLLLSNCPLSSLFVFFLSIRSLFSIISPFFFLFLLLHSMHCLLSGVFIGAGATLPLSNHRDRVGWLGRPLCRRLRAARGACLPCQIFIMVANEGHRLCHFFLVFRRERKSKNERCKEGEEKPYSPNFSR